MGGFFFVRWPREKIDPPVLVPAVVLWFSPGTAPGNKDKIRPQRKAHKTDRAAPNETPLYDKFCVYFAGCFSHSRYGAAIRREIRKSPTEPKPTDNMKRAAPILCLSLLTLGVCGQGIINFQNSGQTLISVGNWFSTSVMPNSTAATFYFALLTAPPGSTAQSAFTFTGLYATNTAATTGGRLSGGNGIQVPGWGAGVSMSYEIVGWDASLGHSFNTAWLTTGPPTLRYGVYSFFGISPIATGTAGGTEPLTGNTLPPYNLFGGATGIPTGFTLNGTVPEPSGITLAGLGAAIILIFARRK
jgi:hypothetical protein